MTDRINHEEARSIIRDNWERQSPKDGLLRLGRYVDQQQALEADTVSRAEHERAVLTRDRDLANLRKDVKALLEHVTTERARAEEAEMQLGNARALAEALGEQWRKDGVVAELAAANARAARLEEASRRLADAVTKAGHHVEFGELRTAWKELLAALSTAPQASTEQAPPSLAVGDFDGRRYDSLGGYEVPAQPAPGVTERCERPLLVFEMVDAIRALHRGGYDPTEGMFRELAQNLENLK